MNRVTFFFSSCTKNWEKMSSSSHENHRAWRLDSRWRGGLVLRVAKLQAATVWRIHRVIGYLVRICFVHLPGPMKISERESAISFNEFVQRKWKQVCIDRNRASGTIRSIDRGDIQIPFFHLVENLISFDWSNPSTRWCYSNGNSYFLTDWKLVSLQ